MDLLLPRPPLFFLIFSWLFPQIDAALHHGGAGTTGASLRGTCVFYVYVCASVRWGLSLFYVVDYSRHSDTDQALVRVGDVVSRLLMACYACFFWVLTFELQGSVLLGVASAEAWGAFFFFFR